jgi:hypothetical protein
LFTYDALGLGDHGVQAENFEHGRVEEWKVIDKLVPCGVGSELVKFLAQFILRFRVPR